MEVTSHTQVLEIEEVWATCYYIYMSTYIQLMATDPLVRIGFKRLIQGWGWGAGGEVLIVTCRAPG